MLGFAYVKSAAGAASVGLAVCCLPLTAAWGAQTAPRASVAPPVATVGKARFEGEWTSSGSAVFRGIPYAQPPVKGLRWKPPQPMTPRAGQHSAVIPAPTCLQAFVGWNRVDEERSAEDCLYLDIRTPRM